MSHPQTWIMKFTAGIVGLSLLATAGTAGAQDGFAGQRDRWHERRHVSVGAPQAPGGQGWTSEARVRGPWRARALGPDQLLPAALGLSAGPPPPWHGGDEQEEARRAVREGRQISLGQALDAIRRHTPGRQLDAGMQPGPGGRMVYKVRWATADGRRIDYLVDAQTGQIIGEDR